MCWKHIKWNKQRKAMTVNRIVMFVLPKNIHFCFFYYVSVICVKNLLIKKMVVTYQSPETTLPMNIVGVRQVWSICWWIITLKPPMYGLFLVVYHHKKYNIGQALYVTSSLPYLAASSMTWTNSLTKELHTHSSLSLKSIQSSKKTWAVQTWKVNPFCSNPVI